MKDLAKNKPATEGRIDILESYVHEFEKRVDKRFETVDKRFNGLDKRIDGLGRRMNDGFQAVDERFDIQARGIVALREDVDTIKSTMATKSDLRDVNHSIEYLTTIVVSIRNDNLALTEWLKRHDIQIATLSTAMNRRS